MEFLDLAYERIDSLERALKENQKAGEARRLGLTPQWSALALFDGMLIRAGRNADQRQARRERRTGHRTELAS
jgi:hypothetical protein